MSRSRVLFALLLLVPAGCDSGPAARSEADVEALRTYDELRLTQGELERMKEQNARLRAELDAARAHAQRAEPAGGCIGQMSQRIDTVSEVAKHE